MKDTAMRRTLDNLDVLHLLWGAKVLKFLHRKITLLNMLFNFLLPLFPSSYNLLISSSGDEINLTSWTQ